MFNSLSENGRKMAQVPKQTDQERRTIVRENHKRSNSHCGGVADVNS